VQLQGLVHVLVSVARRHCLLATCLCAVIGCACSNLSPLLQIQQAAREIPPLLLHEQADPLGSGLRSAEQSAYIRSCQGEPERLKRQGGCKKQEQQQTMSVQILQVSMDAVACFRKRFPGITSELFESSLSSGGCVLLTSSI
jgi:hypothetical protein